MSGLLAIASEVAEALAAGRPVVALETTVVTHGLPHPDGLAAAAAMEAAVRAHLELRLGSGVVVANPVPAEHEMPREAYESALHRALADVATAGVRGRAVTPFLLEKMRTLTADRSVATNRALLLNNARAAGALASALGSSDASLRRMC